MTKAEKAELDKVVSRGCIVCEKWHNTYSPAEAHHVRKGQGTGRRAGNDMVIPLCPQHHRIGGYGVAYHAGAKAFAEKYADELTLLEMVKEQ